MYFSKLQPSIQQLTFLAHSVLLIYRHWKEVLLCCSSVGTLKGLKLCFFLFYQYTALSAQLPPRGYSGGSFVGKASTIRSRDLAQTSPNFHRGQKVRN